MPKQANIRETIAQMAIDIPGLQAYFHPEAEGRKPLQILKGVHCDTAWKLSKFGVPVQFAAKGEPKKMPLLEFKQFDLGDDTAAVAMDYAIEGIHVTARFGKDAAGSWALVEHKLVER